MLGFDTIVRKIFGSENDRKIKAARKTVEAVNALEPQMEALSDEELAGKTAEFRDRLAKGETLDDLLPEAFATVREASKRTLGMRPFDVQIIGGLTLHPLLHSHLLVGHLGQTIAPPPFGQLGLWPRLARVQASVRALPRRTDQRERGSPFRLTIFQRSSTVRIPSPSWISYSMVT